jgi:hypothetical protein
MKILNTWEETLQYVNRLGLVNNKMPIGWKQQVLMANVNLIESLSIDKYPITVRYSRKNDEFIVDNLSAKAVHN